MKTTPGYAYRIRAGAAYGGPSLPTHTAGSQVTVAAEVAQRETAFGPTGPLGCLYGEDAYQMYLSNPALLEAVEGNVAHAALDRSLARLDGAAALAAAEVNGSIATYINAQYAARHAGEPSLTRADIAIELFSLVVDVT